MLNIKKNENNIIYKSNKEEDILTNKMYSKTAFKKNIIIKPDEPNEPNEPDKPDIIIMEEDNYDKYEDNIRAPIPSTSDILIDDTNNNFIEFQKSIMADNTLDSDMKQILIQSRLDTIKKYEEKSKSNIEKSFRAVLISILIVRLKKNEYKKINQIQKEFVLKQIDKWIDGKINIIKLDSEILYEINELIDEIKFLTINFDDLKIKKIFEPHNKDDYICFIDTMEIIKSQSIKEEQERINNKIKQKNLEEETVKKLQEEEEKKIYNMKVRKELLQVLILNLNKLSLIEDKTKILKELILTPINNYIELVSDYIEISNNETLIEFEKFIKSIRIIKETKEKILNLIKFSSI